MNERLRAFAARHGGVFTRRAALESGYADPTIYAMVRRGRWRRIRHGVYVETDRWEAAGPADRHLMCMHGVALRCGRHVVFTHVSAAVAYGWPVWNLALDVVCVTRRRPSRSREQAGAHHFLAGLPEDQIREVGGFLVSSKERTMVDAARHYGFEEATVICDAGLRDGADLEEVGRIHLACTEWPYARGVYDVLTFADGRAESVGESRLRVACHLQGLPAMTPQVPILGPHGVIGVVDLDCEGFHTCLEFDGKVKYGMAGRDPREQVFREKVREDGIREHGRREMVRVVWSELRRPEEIATRVRAAIRRAAVRRGLRIGELPTAP